MFGCPGFGPRHGAGVFHIAVALWPKNYVQEHFSPAVEFPGFKSDYSPVPRLWMNGSVPPHLVYYVAWCCSMCAADMEVLLHILFLWYFGVSSGHGVPESRPKPSLFSLSPSTLFTFSVPSTYGIYDIIVTSLRAVSWARQLSRLRGGRSGDWIPVGEIFPAPVQTGPGAHPASCTMGTGSFPRVKSGRAVTLAPHPHLAPWSRKSRVIPLLPLWAVRTVQSFSASKRVHFTFFSPFTMP